jgi:hypothetical protein
VWGMAVWFVVLVIGSGLLALGWAAAHMVVV